MGFGRQRLEYEHPLPGWTDVDFRQPDREVAPLLRRLHVE
jgi:hypothetical protein